MRTGDALLHHGSANRGVAAPSAAARHKIVSVKKKAWEEELSRFG
jgi:hypothetical protein